MRKFLSGRLRGQSSIRWILLTLDSSGSPAHRALGARHDDPPSATLLATMSETVDLDDLGDDEIQAVKLLRATLATSVNVATGTLVAAVAHTTTNTYAGAQLQLTLPVAVHAEAAALAAAHTAGDLDVHALYLTSRRADGQDTGHVTPCGSCCQLIHDVGVYTGNPIRVLSLDERANTVLVIQPGSLLPYAFESQKLQRAGQVRRGHQS